ncbi:hypothetical protein [Bradyrhizobium elkanii]
MTTLEVLDAVKNGLWTGLEWAQGSWSKIPELARSLLSAAIGVLFGAWIASRTQNKRLIVAELHALRGAHALTFAIINKALSIKRQHLRPMKMAFDTAANYIANPQGPGAVQLDLRDLSQIRFPTDALEKLLLEKCFLGSEAVATLVAVMDATDDLTTSIRYRNEQVIDFKKNPPATHQQKIERYFGLPAANGERDERIKSNIGALLEHANDCIFFGRRLSDHILKSENRLRRRNFWKYWLPGRKLKPADWGRAEADNLLPPDAGYANWVSGFIKDRSAIERLWDSFKGHIHWARRL